VPVFVFGVFWQGGDMERYLPLFPFLFLAVAGLWSQVEARTERVLVAGFFVLLVLVNGVALSRWQVSQYRRDLTQRIDPLREHLTPNSQVIVVRDRLKLLPRDFPFASSGVGLSVVETAVPGLEETRNWRRDFALW
jgi:hypothetical protein